MTHEEMINLLQDQAQHYRITAKELESECEKYNIAEYEDVLEPIGFNICDRCGEYGWSEQDFLWTDWFAWDEDNEGDRAIIKAINDEGIDYCALCWDCVNKLKEKGAKCI